jgi:hypothetical protein
LTFEATQSQSTSLERSWTYSADINVPAHKLVKASFVVNEGQYNTPFTAKVQVRGSTT